MNTSEKTEVSTDNPNLGVAFKSYFLAGQTASISVLNWKASGAYFCDNLVNAGPATTAVITDTIKPKINIIPMLAPKAEATAVGAGCGGKNPCAELKAAVKYLSKAMVRQLQ